MTRRFSRCALALAAAATCAGTAHAETGPYAVGVSETLSQESNPLRTRDALAQSEVISTTSLDFLIDQPIGRQKFKANAQLSAQRFSDTKAWDNNPYRLGAELDWSTVDRWEGELGFDTGRELYRYDQNAATPQENQQRSTRAWLRARVGVITTWTFEAGLTAYERDLSLAAFDRLDQKQWAGEAGLRYRYSPDLDARVMLRHTDGEYPRFSALGADEFRRNDVEFSARWAASGASTLNARFSFGTESHTQQDIRGGDIWAGALTWLWLPTGKLALSTTLQRDSDIGSSRFAASTDTSTGSTGGTGTGSVGLDQITDASVSTSLALAAKWAATSKIALDASARYVRRTLENTSTSGSSQRGNDATTILSLGAMYSPTRAIDLGCKLSRERRNTPADSLSLSYPYGNTVVSCSGQFWLR